MDDYSEEGFLDFESYPKTENYMVKRVFAYLIDLLLMAAIVFAIVLISGVEMSSVVAWVIVIIIVGFLTTVYKAAMEGAKGNTIGKGIMGLKVVSAYEGVTVGESFIRNISGIIPLVLPLIDFVAGTGSSEDDRQKLMDRTTKTLVVEDIVIVEEKPVLRRVPPPREEKPEPKEKVRLDYRRMRYGNCPRCGAPYRILDPGDDSFSGLWNYRCTWCNAKVLEGSGRGRD